MAKTADVHCLQKLSPEATLECHYRFFQPSKNPTIQASSGGKVLLVSPLTKYPETADLDAFLFLVDVSDPARRATVAANAKVIKVLIEKGLPHQRFGIAIFDKEVHLLAPLGSDGNELKKAVNEIHAQGLITEFYRSILKSIELLAAFPAKRKALVLFSDGLAEDVVYRHEDVIPKATEAGVVIYGLGYADSIEQAPALQRLRRLAEETGGPFAEADGNRHLPKTMVDEFFSYLDNGGRFNVALSQLHGKKKVAIRIHQDNGMDAIRKIAVFLPEPAPSLPVPSRANNRPTLPQVPIHADDFSKELVLVFSTPHVGIGSGVVLLLLWFLVRTRKKRLQGPVLATLEVVDDGGATYEIRQPIYRIGRNANNDLQLLDESVSGFHAEIHQNREGGFKVTDLSSTNGTLVNEKKASTHLLEGGDMIKLGNVCLCFHPLAGDVP
ncbi:MAG: FHA domain-containing protein [Magnetococcales bacterium]|nr:FHA domain-containing protein [Magnetococcales bacterium]